MHTLINIPDMPALQLAFAPLDAFEDAINAMLEPIIEAYWASEYERVVRMLREKQLP